jgi:hypothetical protein
MKSRQALAGCSAAAFLLCVRGALGSLAFAYCCWCVNGQRPL